MLNCRGQIRILEAFLATAIIFVAMLPSMTAPSPPDLEKQSFLMDVGMQVLTKLDTEGILGQLIKEEDWSKLEETLDILLPKGVLFNLTVYDENMVQINAEPVRNSGSLGVNVVSVQYVLVCHTVNIQFCNVRLLLAWIGGGD